MSVVFTYLLQQCVVQQVIVGCRLRVAAAAAAHVIACGLSSLITHHGSSS